MLIVSALGDGLGNLAHAGSTPTGPRPGTLQTGGATQLGLFTAEGLVRLHLRLIEKGIGPAWDVNRHALDRWVFTQGRPVHAEHWGNGSDWPDGWLVRQHPLHRRISGFESTFRSLTVTIADLETPRRGRPSPRVNLSNGAGALVRVASGGLIFDSRRAFWVGAITSAYTHGGADAYLAGASLASILAYLLEDRGIDEAVALTRDELALWPDSQGISGALNGKAGPGSSRAARSLEKGIAYGRQDDEATSLIARAVAAGGTAAAVVTGAIVGARSGASGLPSDWRVWPDVIHVIEEMGDAVSLAHRDWVMGRRPSGWEYDPATVDWESWASQVLSPRFPGW